MFTRITQYLETHFFIGPHGLVTREVPLRNAHLMLGIKASSNMTSTLPPFNYAIEPSSATPPMFDPKIALSVKIADIATINERVGCQVTGDFAERHIFLPSTTFSNPKFIPDPAGSVPSLFVLAARKYVEYNRVFGDTKGKPHFRHALTDLDVNNKYENTILLMDRPVRDVTDVQRAALVHAEEAMDRVHRMNGTSHLIGTVPAEFDFRALQGVSLGASNGIYSGNVYKVTKNGVMYVVSPRGKKYESFEAVIHKLISSIDKRKPFPVYWAITPKHEMKFSFSHQMDEDSYQKWIMKHRVFVIPSSIFVFAERLSLIHI